MKGEGMKDLSRCSRGTVPNVHQASPLLRTINIGRLLTDVSLKSLWLFVTALFPAAHLGLAANSLEPWHIRAANFPLVDVAFGGGVYLAVAADGTILRSTDAIKWDEGAPGTWSGVAAVAFGANQFVAVGSEGEALTSTDGLKWTATLVPEAAGITDIEFGGDRFVAVGRSGRLMSSPDGREWAFTTPPASVQFGAVAYGNGRFVAVGLTPNPSSHPAAILSAVLTSEDGTRWNPVDIGPGIRLNRVAFGRGMFAAIGPDWTTGVSVDGQTWRFKPRAPGITQPGDTAPAAIFSAKDRFVVPLMGAAMRTYQSEDGEGWQPSRPTSVRRVVAGSHGFIGVDGANSILQSEDGLDWRVVHTRPRYSSFGTLRYLSDRFVAAGPVGRVIVSKEGTTWTEQVTAIQMASIPGSISDMASGNGRTVFATTSALSLHETTDPELRRFVPAELPADPSLRGAISLAFGNGTFVAIVTRVPPAPGLQEPVPPGPLRSTILYSPGGEPWREADLTSTNELTGITFGAGRFVAFGSRVLLTSTDGRNWATSSVIPGVSILSASYGAGRLVLVGTGNRSFLSENGIDWRTVMRTNFISPMSLSFGQGQFIGVTTDGSIYASTDGEQWQRTSAPLVGYGTYSTSRVAFGAGTFVVNGSQRLLQSSAGQAAVGMVHFTPDGQIELQFDVDPGFYRIERSDDLVLWETLRLTAIVTEGRVLAVTVPTVANARQQFYRAVRVGESDPPAK
jgi:hypothetical protein